MAIEIKLIGFGDQRPALFGTRDNLSLELETPASPWQVLRKAGIDDVNGLVLMNVDRVIPQNLWHDSIVDDNCKLTLLSVFEGG